MSVQPDSLRLASFCALDLFSSSLISDYLLFSSSILALITSLSYLALLLSDSMMARPLSAILVLYFGCCTYSVGVTAFSMSFVFTTGLTFGCGYSEAKYGAVRFS